MPLFPPTIILTKKMPSFFFFFSGGGGEGLLQSPIRKNVLWKLYFKGYSFELKIVITVIVQEKAVYRI